MKNTLSTLEKFSDSYCYGPFRPFEAILLNTGQNSRSNRYANTIAAMFCVLLFFFSSFSCVFFSYYTLSPPSNQSTPLSLLVRPKAKIQLVCKYNSSQCFVFYCFSFFSFSRVFFSYYTLSPPSNQSTPLSLLVRPKAKIQSVRKYNSSQCFVFYCFSFFFIFTRFL